MSRDMLTRRPLPSVFPSFGRDFDQLNTSIRRMFDNPFAMATEFFPNVPQTLGWMPPVEVSEMDDALVVTVELPGAKMEDIHVSLEGDVLTVRGEKTESHEEKDAEKKYHVFERSYGAFQRAFALPRSVDPEKVNARFDNGVLEITLKKAKTAKMNGREIAVTAK